jgi:hypothetical protein
MAVVKLVKIDSKLTTLLSAQQPESRDNADSEVGVTSANVRGSEM